MPQLAQSLSEPSLSSTQLLILSYGSFHQLGWTVEFATDDRLVGYSKKKWGAYYDHIIVDTEDGSLTITSRLPESASFDLFKKNKKNIGKFLTAFESVKTSSTEENKNGWRESIEALKEHTHTTIEKEVVEAQEIDAVMNLSSGSKLVTYIIMGLNILVFIIMVASGVHFFEPSTGDLAKWGGNYKPYTIGSDWWRLITSVFIHGGIIHLAFNMYALYMVGLYLEPMLGKWRYSIAYLCTGILASIASIWWHGSDSVSVGASGAIFGMYGVLLSLLTTKLIPKTMRISLLQSMGIFVVYNLIYGARSSSIDNAAHLGGLISGFVIGYIYFISLKTPERIKPVAISLIVLAITIVSTVFYLKGAVLDDVTVVDDDSIYSQKVDEILVIQDSAMAPFDRYVNDSSMLRDISANTKPLWKKAKEIIDETANYKLDKGLSHRKFLKEYIELRIKETDLIIKGLQGDNSMNTELKDVQSKISALAEQMKQ